LQQFLYAAAFFIIGFNNAKAKSTVNWVLQQKKSSNNKWCTKNAANEVVIFR
jgi:hypothetical protein